MTDAPISYADARAAVNLASFHFRKAGPHGFGMTAEKYAALCLNLEKVEKLLSAIVEHRAQRTGAST